MKNLIVQLTTEELSNLITKSVKSVFSEQQTSEEYLTRKQACKMLSISFNTFTNYVNKGHLIKYKIDNRVYVKRSDIVSFLESNRIG